MLRKCPPSTRIIALVAVCCAPASVSPLQAQSQSTSPLVANQQPEGVLEPWKTSNVACAESGLLETVFVKPGDRVKSGEVLAQLDMALADVQLAIAQAQSESQGKMDQVRAEAELAEKKVRSIQQAREKKHSTQSELDRAIAELKIVEGRLQAEKDESQILSLQAERMEKLLEQRKVTTPIDGIVVKLLKSPGEFVSPNSPEVVRVVDISKLRASFFLQLHEIASIKVGSKIKVDVAGGGQKAAVVEHMAPFPDGGSGLIEVQVLLDNPEMKIFGSRCTLLIEPSANLVSGR
ncbi:MAG: efflux RND transporter periplasmic adaptor subunit [Planctomycetes bacterium]|nr:efflux RND transporter periplasmic adaptor subunit [Planctomycetota bacterium]